jgi:hypothetical protein
MKSSIKELPVTKDIPEAIVRKVEWGGMQVSVQEFHQTLDAAPLCKGLPGDQCQLPHWGYILEGQMRCKFGNREEVYNAGDVIYHPPGHTTVWEAGLVYISFTPADEYKKQAEMLQAIRQAMPGQS